MVEPGEDLSIRSNGSWFRNQKQKSTVARREKQMKTKSCILKCKVQTKVDSRGNTKEVGSWKEELADTHTVNKKVPWYLDDGTSQVFVLQTQRASNFWNQQVHM